MTDLRTEAGRRLLASDIATTGWSGKVVTDFLAEHVAAIETAAVTATLERLRAVVEAVLTSFDYEGTRHSPRCNRIVFPGNAGPDPEPPDPCSCDGPAVLSAIDQEATRG